MKNLFKHLTIIFFVTLSSFFFTACGEPVEIKVMVSPSNDNVSRGGTKSFKAVVSGMNGIPQDVAWSVTGKGTNSNTSIDSEGVLTVDNNETSASLTIQAALKHDKQIKGQAAVTVYTSITSASINVAIPVNGATPSATASATGTGYTISRISWTPTNSKFLGSTVYTVSITATANEGYKFSELISANINGQIGTITNKTETSISVSYTFPATSIKRVSGINVKTQPSNITYTHGGTIDLSGLVVTFTYDDTTTEDIPLSDFTEKNITTLPSHGNTLVRSTHDNQGVKINYGDLTVNTHNLTVNPKVITFNVDPIEDRIYSGSDHAPTVTVKDGEFLLTLNTHYVVTYSNNLNAGTATVTITGIGNYAGSSGIRTFTILQPVSSDRFEYFWVNEHGDLVTTSNGATLVTPGNTLTITASGTGYTVKQWHLNGVNTGQSGNSYNFSSSVLGRHTIGLFVEKDDKIYNSNIVIKVVEVIYTVTFNSNNATGGTVPSPITTDSNITLPGQGTLLRTGYTFGGWNTNSSGTGTNYSTGSTFTPTDNITLYARWNIITYTITYNVNNGTGTTPTAQTVNAGSSITLASGSGLSRTGYTFDGWNTNSSGTGTNYNAGSSYTPTGNITLYAKWNITYTITYNVNNGTGTTPTAQTVNTGSNVTLASGSGLSRTGYTFDGWNTNSSGTGTNYNSGSSYTPTGNITLYARWNITYTITYNRNSGTGTTPTAQTVNSGSNVTLASGSGLSRTGYTFGGWNTNSSGTGTNYGAGSSYTPTGNITLYAKWDIAYTYTITYNINNGTGTTPTVQTVNPGSNITLASGSGFTRSGYTFAGWNTNSSGTGTNYNAGSSYTPTGNITLYAKWNSTGSGITTTPLTANIWANGTLSATTSEVWYSFSVTSGTTYRIWWNDSHQGNSTKTGDIVVGARYRGSSTWIFGGSYANVDSGYTTAQSFTANQTGTVEIRVIPYNRSSYNTGTFGIVYSTSTTRPSL